MRNRGTQAMQEMGGWVWKVCETAPNPSKRFQHLGNLRVVEAIIRPFLKQDDEGYHSQGKLGCVSGKVRKKIMCFESTN